MKSKVPIPNGILYLAIVLVNCIVYFPALGHVGRADQIIYLIDTAKFNNDSLPAFILKTYSYPRSREINTGDEILFRPVLFIFLAIEKWFFGYNFVWWQALGIILHLALLWQAIRIMCLVSENPFSFLFVLSFSVLFVSQEMVIWHAINGYLLCLIFVAGAFYHLIKLLQSDLNDDKQLPFIVGFLTMACFTYEFGLVCAMIFSLMVLAKKYLMRDRESRMRSLRQFPELIIAFPVLIYIAVSSVDYLLRLGWHLPGMYKTPPVSAAQAFLSLILDFFQSVFLPAFLMITANERSSIDTLPWHNILLSRGPHGFWQTFNWVFFLAIVAAGIYFLYDAMKCRLVRRIVAREVSVNDKKDLKIIMWGALILAFSYLLMIAVGRGKMYNGLYHYYIFAFFAMLGSHFLFLMLEKYFEKTKFIKPVFFLFFILLSLLNGYQSFRFNNYRRSREMICSDFFKQVDHFVRRHKNEKDFTFQVLSAEINMWGRYYIGRSPWGVKQKVNVINYLFARYIDSAAPKYYLVHSRNGLYAARSKQEAASYLANLRKKHNRR